MDNEAFKMVWTCTMCYTSHLTERDATNCCFDGIGVEEFICGVCHAHFTRAIDACKCCQEEKQRGKK